MPRVGWLCAEQLRRYSVRRQLMAMNWGTGLLLLVAGAFVGWFEHRALRRARSPLVVSFPWCVCGTSLLWLATGWRWMSAGFPDWWLPVPLVVTALTPPLVLSDLRHRRLPDVLTLPAYLFAAVAIGMAASFGADGGVVIRALLGVVLFGGAHALVHAVAPTALGAGDVKLSGSLGALLGATGWFALGLAACLAALVTVTVSLLTAGPTLRSAPSSGVPYGPGLLVATCLVVVFPGTDVAV